MYKGWNVEKLLQNVVDTVMSKVTKIQTSLYDLITMLNTEISPDEDNRVTATVMYLLNTHRVTCTGVLQGYRLVCSDGARSEHTIPRGHDHPSHFESHANHHERPHHIVVP